MSNSNICTAVLNLPHHILLSQINFDRIIEICNRNDTYNRKIRQIETIIRALLPREAPRANPQIENLNDAQSTHTASVHRSVSESVKKLFVRYEKIINEKHNSVSHIITELSDWINNIPDADDIKIIAAKKCIARITAEPDDFTDPCSQVSIQQLLALIWLAIHDNAKRIGTIEDAKNVLIEGLYEIQRGYNIGANRVDNNAPVDKIICKPGAFNKLVEKLQSVDPDVEVLLITKSIFCLKLPQVVIEKAKNYLQKFKNENSKEDFLSLLNEILEEIEIPNKIWDKIQAEVLQEMSEFEELYTKKHNTPETNKAEFTKAINGGRYTDLENLAKEFIAELEKTEKMEQKEKSEEQAIEKEVTIEQNLTILQIEESKTENPIISPLSQEKQNFSQEVNAYIDQRNAKKEKTASSYYRYSIFGRLAGLSAEVKINAAAKMIAHLKDSGPLKWTFTDKDIEALREGGLAKIIAKHEKILSEKLPENFLSVEKNEIINKENPILSKINRK